MGFWDFLPGVGDAPKQAQKPAPKQAPKQHVPTDLEKEKTPSWKADRTKPPLGGKVSPNAWSILDEVSRRINSNLQVQQGGHNPRGDPTSAGTHDGGGAVDLFVKGLSKQQQLDAVAELRRQGVAAWLRTPEYGWNVPNDDHIHAIFMDDPDLSPVAREQVTQYLNRQNGLASHAPDPFPLPAAPTAAPNPWTPPPNLPPPPAMKSAPTSTDVQNWNWEAPANMPPPPVMKSAPPTWYGPAFGYTNPLSIPAPELQPPAPQAPPPNFQNWYATGAPPYGPAFGYTDPLSIPAPELQSSYPAAPPPNFQNWNATGAPAFGPAFGNTNPATIPKPELQPPAPQAPPPNFQNWFASGAPAFGPAFGNTNPLSIPAPELQPSYPAAPPPNFQNWSATGAPTFGPAFGNTNPATIPKPEYTVPEKPANFQNWFASGAPAFGPAFGNTNPTTVPEPVYKKEPTGLVRGSQNDPANWPRNAKGELTTTGATTPDQVILDMLKQGGWTVPEVYRGEQALPKGMELEGEPNELTGYSYGITSEEWARVQEMLQGRTGYTPPAAPKTAPPTTPTTQTNTGPTAGYPAPGGVNMAPPPEKEVLPNFTMESTQYQPMAYDAYAKLSPDQKAGLDLNALMVNAREKDLTETAAPTDEQRKVYDKDVETYFGPGRGSEKYAPETVALVKQLNLNIPGMDLDQVLALDYTLTPTDLQQFELKGAATEEHYGAGAGGGGDAGVQAVYNQIRSEENQRLALVDAVRQSKGAIEKAMSDLYSVRGDVVSTMAGGRKADVTSYGGPEMEVPAQPGYPLGYPGGIEPTGLTEDERGKNMFYTAAYELLANKKKPLSDLWALVENSPAAADQVELDALFAYFDQRTKQEAQYGRPKGIGGEGYRTPEEIREWIGLDK